MNLWLDDVRNPSRYGRDGWTWAQSVVDAVAILSDPTRSVYTLSLDYDLEDDGYGCATCMEARPCWSHSTGADLVTWLSANVLLSRWPPRIEIHTLNHRGAERMNDMIRAAGYTGELVRTRLRP